MVYLVAACVSALIGVIIGNAVNYKATTNQNIGHVIGLVVAIALFLFFISDEGRAYIVRTFARLNIRF